MRIVDVGSGPPVIVIPGIQGRWEWMTPGIEALATRCRVVTFSLADEPTCQEPVGGPINFECYVSQVLEAMNRVGLERATICGISYGGLIAAAFAARHPERTSGLVLVSAVPPSWKPDERVKFYLRAPRLLTPLFIVGSLRMYREIAASQPDATAGLREAARHGWNVLTHMFSPTRMARRVDMLATREPIELSAVRAATLIVTGDPALDCVVPVRATHEYAALIKHARMATIERTGHLGLITRPQVFTDVVAPFVRDAAAHESRRRVV